MTPGTHVFLSGLLTFGVPLVLAAYELIALRRAEDGPGRPDGPRDPAPAPPPGCEPCSRPLPACLTTVPRTDAVDESAERERVLEPA